MMLSICLIPFPLKYFKEFIATNKRFLLVLLYTLDIWKTAKSKIFVN